jgi:DNA repair protein RecO (recombination protein O)
LQEMERVRHRVVFIYVRIGGAGIGPPSSIRGLTSPEAKTGKIDWHQGEWYLRPMENCRCDALLLGVTDFGESDKIVTLFTLEQGKLKGIARGAKKSHRRFGGSLEPFARVSVQITLKSGLSVLTGADAVTIFPRIREDLLKIGYAAYACEAVDLLLPEGLPNPRLYRLLAAYLEHLDQVPPSPSDRKFFEINLLNIMGYRPALNRCASCGTELATAPRLFATVGGILCGRCGRGGRVVSPETVGFLEASLRTGRFGTVCFPATSLTEAGFILEPALSVHASRPFKSLSFLREIGGERCAEVS